MGACVKPSSDSILLPDSDPLPTSIYPQDLQTSAHIQQINDELILSHSPLYTNIHLKKLFDTNSQIPEEITFNYMLKPEDITITNNTELTLEGCGTAQIWLITSATECLTTRIKDYTSMTHQHLDLKEISIRKVKVQGLYHVQGKTDLILIIESTSSGESRYMIYCFEVMKDRLRLVRQKYNWCGLSFLIEDIYGSMQDQMNVKAMELCAICMALTANTMFVPCRHMCVCEDCGKSFMKETKQSCPICRKTYTNLIAYVEHTS